MEREHRYYLANKKDVEKHLSYEQQTTLHMLMTKINVGRLRDDKPVLQTVCVDSDWPEHEIVRKMIDARVDGKASPASAPEGFTMSEPTLLPDGSAFGTMSFHLPKNHWLYADREYEEGALEPKDLPAPILTHALRQQVIAAIRYAVRSATNCGKEDDFDPDALVQNAVYALCGPYGKAAPTPPSTEDRWLPIATAPKDGTKFLAWRRHSTLPLIVHYNDEYNQCEYADGILVYGITHWMRLPKAPTMQEDKT